MLQLDQLPIDRLRGCAIDGGRPIQHFRRKISRERLHLPRRYDEPEKHRRNVGKLMRLVDDDGIGARQQVAEAFFLQHEVGHQQVMIDDDHVSGLRIATRLYDVTAIE